MGRLIASGRAFAIVAALSSLAGMAEAAESPEAITVTYGASLISLDARDAPLSAVLAEVGARAGFTVVQAGGPARRVTIAIQEATLDDVLRQLLRSENHTLLYRAEQGHPGGVLDQVVLMGSAPAGPAVATPEPGRASPAGAGSPAAAGAPPTAPTSQPSPLSALEPSTEPSDDAEPTVSDVLRSHATATLRATEAARAAAPATDTGATRAPAPAPGGPGSIQISPAAQDALATATRQAQQNLKALVDGLDAATQSLQQQPSQPGIPQQTPRLPQQAPRR